MYIYFRNKPIQLVKTNYKNGKQFERSLYKYKILLLKMI